MTTSKVKDTAENFESAISRLEQLVEQMESGQLSIEDALTAFEEGINLTRHCQSILQEAEQKVKILTESTGEIKESPFVLNGDNT